mmetsp:Transcript_95258/g.269241  ORF Transcript_95258/g.269241 Transcript_95258/m.269241 type:complete len:369 (+) Transcript_95258:121-1227(+)
MVASPLSHALALLLLAGGNSAEECTAGGGESCPRQLSLRTTSAKGYIMLQTRTGVSHYGAPLDHDATLRKAGPPVHMALERNATLQPSSTPLEPNSTRGAAAEQPQQEPAALLRTNVSVSPNSSLVSSGVAPGETANTSTDVDANEIANSTQPQAWATSWATRWISTAAAFAGTSILPPTNRPVFAQRKATKRDQHEAPSTEGGHKPLAPGLYALHIPALTLRYLHENSSKSLADFLLQLTGIIGGAANVSHTEVRITSIHEQFRRDADNVRNQELVVLFSAPWHPMSAKENVGPDEAASMLGSAVREQMQTASAEMKKMLRSCTVGLNHQSRLVLSPTTGSNLVPVVALPFGISAAFTGILIWLATL